MLVRCFTWCQRRVHMQRRCERVIFVRVVTVIRGVNDQAHATARTTPRLTSICLYQPCFSAESSDRAGQVLSGTHAWSAAVRCGHPMAFPQLECLKKHHFDGQARFLSGKNYCVVIHAVQTPLRTLMWRLRSAACACISRSWGTPTSCQPSFY
jgi:hypothetical protein